MAIGVLLFAVFSYRQFESDFRREVERQLSAIADLKSADLVRWRNERLSDAHLVYGNSAFADLVHRSQETPRDAAAQMMLADWLALFSAHFQYEQAILVDPQGHVIQADPAVRGGLPAHLTVDCTAALDSHTVTFVDFHRDTENGAIYLSLLIPIYSEAKEALGTLVLRMDPEVNLYPFLQRWPIPSNSGETLLVRREGDSVVFLNDLRFQEDAALRLRYSIYANRLPASMVARGMQGILEGSDYRGVEVIADLRAVPDSPWYLVTKIDAEDLYAPLRTRLTLTILLACVALAAGGAFAYFLWHQQRIRFYRERYLAAETLRLLSMRQEAILDSVPDIIMEVDSRKVYTWANRRGFEFFGEDVIGLEASAFFLGDQATYQIVQPLFEGGEDIIYVESWQRRRDGERRLLAWWCRVLKDKQGQVTGALSTARDITEQKEAEERIRSSEARYATIFHDAGEGILIADAETRQIRYANPAICSMLGYTEAELTALSIDAIHPPDQWERIRQVFQAMAAGSIHEAIDIPCLRKDGSVLIVVIHSSTVEFDGRPHNIGLFTDVTERRREERAIREHEQRLASIYATAGDVIFYLAVEPDGQYRFVSVNPAFQKVTGLPDEAVVGRTVQEVIPEPSRSLVLGQYQQAISGRTIVRWEETTDYPSGQLTGEVSIAPVFDESERCTHLVGTVHDITERKKTDAEIRHLNAELEQRVRDRTAQLESANHELEAFAYSVSHDLRAPLRGINGWSTALLEDYGNQFDNRAREYLDRVLHETRMMEALIDDLLQLSRVGRSGLEKTEVDLSSLVRNISARLREHQPGRGVEVIVQPGVTARCDARLMEIALTNLLDNAFKFTGPREKARVEFGRSGSEAGGALFIRDNGVGFDLTYAEKLFGAFQRFHKTSEFPGTGVGLATVQRIIHRHGGKIWADSKPDGGAVFYFTLEEES